MYNLEDIKTVHLEITSQCNARCPMCLRNVLGGKTNPNLPITDLKIHQIESIFSPVFVRQLNKIYLCGNFGDPLMGKDTLLALEYFMGCHPELKLEIFTNGSVQREGWFKRMAELNVSIRFGIDGIGDLNAVYRRNTNFDLIMQNAQNFIHHGGKAHWDYIVFKHNEHQVEEAEALSKQMGFHSFRAKRTGRFFSNQKGSVKDKQEVCDRNGEIEYFIEPPTREKYQNPSLVRETDLIQKYGSFDHYLEQTKIHCRVQKEKNIYISAEGLVFPCCWTAIQLYPWYKAKETGEIWNIIHSLPEGKLSISALHHGLKEILMGSFFQEKIPQTWEKKSFSEGKLRVCSRLCGQEFQSFQEQFK